MTLRLLKKSKIIKVYNVLDFKQGRDFYYIKIKATIINKSSLYIREYVSKDEHLYSYHWQDKDKNLILRWDNAPHYKTLKTFPHHKHTSEGVYESLEINLEDILEIIERTLTQKNF